MFNARVVSTLLYGSEWWTICAAPEHTLNVLHMLLGISCMTRTLKTVVLSRRGLLCSRCFVNSDCAGWVMSDELTRAEFPTILSTKSLMMENTILGVPGYASEMCSNDI